jgi:UDP-glucose 4-epimerase
VPGDSPKDHQKNKMKRILITGEDSYIGTSFENWCSKYADKYEVDTLDIKNSNLKSYSFRGYDAIFHVAGIAHVLSKDNKKELYHSVNCELAYETALKAKTEGVGQIIFMSSIKVFSDGIEYITNETVPAPDSIYGESKLQAEIKLKTLESTDFNVVIIRSPMVYGKDSKGNFPRLVKLSKRMPFVPQYENKRSMIHIDNLCEFVRLMIENEEKGIFHPQNPDYVVTYKMIEKIREKFNKKSIKTKAFNWIIKFLVKHNSTFNKVFGTQVYMMKLSEYKENYRLVNFENSISFIESRLMS